MAGRTNASRYGSKKPIKVASESPARSQMTDTMAVPRTPKMPHRLTAITLAEMSTPN